MAHHDLINTGQHRWVHAQAMAPQEKQGSLSPTNEGTAGHTHAAGGKRRHCYLEVMNSMRVLTFPSCSTEMSTSLRTVVCRWEMAELLFPKLILEEVELELSPESVIGEGW